MLLSEVALGKTNNLKKAEVQICNYLVIIDQILRILNTQVL